MRIYLTRIDEMISLPSSLSTTVHRSCLAINAYIYNLLDSVAIVVLVVAVVLVVVAVLVAVIFLVVVVVLLVLFLLLLMFL